MNLSQPDASSVSQPTAKLPAHETVYQTLRGQILFGDLAPGQAVTIQGLVESLGAGMTPVREAIRRLISDGALVFQGNRRVSVPMLRESDLSELIYARKTIECQLARLATERVTPADISALEAIDTALDQAISAGDVAGYLVQNYQFHTRLYAHADAPILTDLADRLWLRFGPSLRVVCGRLGTQSFPDRHKDILEALNRKDADLAALAMERDVAQGMDQVRQGLKQAS
ncbi:GntR family transcriptional regulator [Phaeobacter gallaeciensis]|uniref:GntR family transcriptional regulator n=1 Tax=Phaeobacter gallaeciensis TaxID=60890 RepID=UPI000BC01D04|nr:GntR family transcriptional regulator [Phaeobacter gallaeciensis]ATF19967.1 HTH-type transcriptional regulator, GntR family [Phaeobacter gallaeciensis]ATF24076.1 HTH-type transcriptional regulator, GntR family [Phaeobacter gallaeciensis]